MLSHPGSVSDASFLHKRASRALLSMVLTSSLILGTASAGADPIGDTSSAEAQISALVSELSNTQESLNALELELGGLRESVNKAMADFTRAQSEAEDAQNAVLLARKNLEETEKALAESQSEMNDISRALYGQGARSTAVSPSMTGEDTAKDSLDRATFLRQQAEAIQKKIDKQEKLRIEAANNESELRTQRAAADNNVISAQEALKNAETAVAESSMTLSNKQVEYNQLKKDQDSAQKALESAQKALKNPDLNDATITEEQRAEAVATATDTVNNEVIPAMQEGATNAEQMARDSVDYYNQQAEGTIFANDADGDAARQELLEQVARAGMQVTGALITEAQGALANSSNSTSDGITTTDGQNTSNMSTSAKIELVINRGKSQLGVPYAWGGGNYHGPTQGIRDGGVADSHGDYNKIGFDCSGLVLYAFYAVGIKLEHYSGYQYTAGRQISVSNIKRGDLLFWGPGGSQHVAIYLGDGTMLEAPQSGSYVKISPVRYAGMAPSAVRLVE